MRVLGSVLQVLGLATVSVGAWLLVVWLGVIVSGVAVFAVGFQLEALHTPGDG